MKFIHKLLIIQVEIASLIITGKHIILLVRKFLIHTDQFLFNYILKLYNVL